MESLLTFERPAYVGLDVLVVPDPEGYPIYREPGTGTLYRCIASYTNATTIRRWLAFAVIDDGNDMQFYGAVFTGVKYCLQRFYRRDVLAAANTGLEFDPIGLQGLEGPLIGVDENNNEIHWEKIDGPVKRPHNWQRYLS
jgi:hypothetical protein